MFFFFGILDLLCFSQVDSVPEVREAFAKKLHKGLNKGIPHRCLPLPFMGFYGLAGLENDKRFVIYFKF